MKKITLASVVVAALTLLSGTTVSNAQGRESLHAAAGQMEDMRRGDGQRGRDGDRDHRHRPVIVVEMPFLVGPTYGSPYLAPPFDVYRTLDGFYYYCAEGAGYYPAVQDCPSGWTLVP